MAKVNDIVRFLNSTGGGKVVRISGNMAYVEDEDGFETPVLLRECVVVGTASDSPAQVNAGVADTPKITTTPDIVTSNAISASDMVRNAAHSDELEEIVETPEGEKINLTLAFEPRDIKQPTTSEIDIFLVNDSNYFISFTLLARGSQSEQWHCMNVGTVEPNIQLLLGELDRTALNDMEHIALQYLAYKTDRPFTLKKPALVEMSVDTTKFFKLHCYKPNIYFDSPVIAMELVHNDEPYTPAPKPDAEALKAAMTAKKAADTRSRRPVVKRKPTKAEMKGGNIVVDLHIQELVDNMKGLSAADMLNLQVDEFRRVMDAHLSKPGTSIVFIHGKGEGVLRNALMKELSHRYRGHDVQDASFREYGFGATQVTIRNLHRK